MLDKQAYGKYLARKKDAAISGQRLGFFDAMENTLARNKTEALSDISEKDIGEFAKSFAWSFVELRKAFDFLTDYAVFLQKEQPNLHSLAGTIQRFCLKRFEGTAKEAAASQKKAIWLIPDGVRIEPALLGALSNGQFVSAFRSLQKFVINAYESIGQAPYAWGYPDYYTTDGFYNRVFDFLYAFVICGAYSDGRLTVDTKKFFSLPSVKKHKKPELMIAGFEKTGFAFNRFDKKTASFQITCRDNPPVITVLNAYIRNLGENALHWSAGEMGKWSFSYRFVEDISAQEFETVFHSKTDLASEELKNIQCWLHGEAEKRGYKINTSHPYEKGCIQYQKGAKSFLLVGEKEIDGVPTVFSKVIFRDISQTEEQKITELSDRFPGTFQSNCNLCGGSKPPDGQCSMRICYELDGKPRRNCAYRSFFFYNPTLDDVKELLRLFLVENRMKIDING